MFTNSEILQSILSSKGYSIHKIYLLMGKNRKVYSAFELNRFTKKFIQELEKIVGEDLSIFINSKIGGK